MRHDIRDYLSTINAEQRSANSSKAGKASGAARRKYKSFQSIYRQVLMLDISDPEMLVALEKLGLEPTYSNAIALQTICKAATGDIEAARFARDTAGDKPTEALRLALSDKPIAAMDLSQLSDAELSALADKELPSVAIEPGSKALSLTAPTD